MTDRQVAGKRPVMALGPAVSGWRLVAARDLMDMWRGGRALLILIFFSILLSIIVFMLATNSEMKLVPPREMVFLIMQIAIAVGLFSCLVISADAISGERERATLEGLLLTPVSRRQIVVGKFLAAISLWPAALAVAVPYLAIISPNAVVFVQAMVWGGLLGSLLVLGFTGLGMLASLWSGTNRTSLAASLAVSLLLVVPTQLPANARAGAVGDFISRMNPLEAANIFLERLLMGNRTVDQMASWLLSPALFAVLILALLFWYAAPRLRLDAGFARLTGTRTARTGLLAATGFQLMLVAATALSVGLAHASSDPGLRLSVDTTYKKVRTGEEFRFTTQVTYDGSGPSAPLVLAMNVINLKNGEPVDPEDWSPRRTQYTGPLAPGGSAGHSWIIHAILDGDYMVYVVAVPSPGSQQASSRPVTASGIHLTVTPYTRLNPGGVLPLAIGVPAGLMLVMYGLRRRRRRQLEID